jgi:hypothetical protein
MNDIAKCPGVIEDQPCLNKDRCLRFTLKSDDMWQPWLTPTYKSPGVCRNFLNNYKDEKANQDRKHRT